MKKQIPLLTLFRSPSTSPVPEQHSQELDKLNWSRLYSHVYLSADNNTMIHLSASGLGELQIVLSTLFFGLSFVGMRVVATESDDPIGPVSFQTCRCFMSLVTILLARKQMKRIIHTDVDNTDVEDNELVHQIKSSLPINVSKYTFDLLFFGAGCGILTCLVSVCQQVGLETLTAGKASFVNGLFVVITPIIEHVLPCYKKPIPAATWLAILLAVVGMYYLAYPQSGAANAEAEESESVGVMWLILSTIFTSIDIMCSDAGAKRVDAIDFTLMMFGISTMLALVVAVLLEPRFWAWPLLALQHGWLLIVLVGVTEGFGYTFGAIGQM